MWITGFLLVEELDQEEEIEEEAVAELEDGENLYLPLRLGLLVL